MYKSKFIYFLFSLPAVLVLIFLASCRQQKSEEGEIPMEQPDAAVVQAGGQPISPSGGSGSPTSEPLQIPSSGSEGSDGSADEAEDPETLSCAAITVRNACNSANCLWSNNLCENTPPEPQQKICSIYSDGQMCSASSNNCSWWMNTCRSLDSTLSALSLSDAAISPSFDPDTYSYTATVGISVSSIDINFTRSNNGSSVTFLGQPFVSGASVPLLIGENEIKIVVTAEDGMNFMEYTLIVTRSGSCSQFMANAECTQAACDWNGNSCEGYVSCYEVPDEAICVTHPRGCQWWGFCIPQQF